jgi:hypothetical protein
MEFARDGGSPSVFGRMGAGTALGLALNAVALGLLVATMAGLPAVCMQLGLWGPAAPEWTEVLIVPVMGAMWSILGFSLFQLLYLVPLGALLAVFRPTRPMALGVVVAMAITVLLNTLCVVGGAGLQLWALSRPGAIH